ncbi:T-lymphocyte activation antigen CD80 isoform X2 [Triplophysa dalaica]|uniref:T-lymphocyte activation antigen CD80 isoform X2 n=1 Tax=Triplophysa dalaica TaxID=1582913 RepID=UPI0024E03966|nr:T-lymphocyte activation antigen CD80 isoform X2 [Triplophysa dalaica]
MISFIFAGTRLNGCSSCFESFWNQSAGTHEDMRSSVCSLFVCISVLLAVKPGEGTETRNLTAVLGESVTLRCPGNGSIPRLYIQKKNESGTVFINGFDTKQDLPIYPQYEYRTTINRWDLSMEMRNISVSDEGFYECVHFLKIGDTKTQINVFYLTVTAKYNIPNVMATCSEPASGARSCRLSCSASGGYPQGVVRWAELNLSQMSDFQNKSLQERNFKTWTISQSLVYNCNQPTNVSCAIGDATSKTTTFCQGDEKFSLDAAAILAIAVLLLIVFIVPSVYIIRKCCRRRRPVPGDAAVEVPLALRTAET